MKTIKQGNKTQHQKAVEPSPSTSVTQIYPEEHTHGSSKPIEYRQIDSCWICTSHFVHKKLKPGYVIIHRNGKSQHLHRYIWQKENGRYLLRGETVKMSCGKADCINPAHMTLGVKSRLLGYRRRKLKMKQAEKIRKLYASGEKVTALAVRFNVHPVTIYNILRNKTYTDIFLTEIISAA